MSHIRKKVQMDISGKSGSGVASAAGCILTCGKDHLLKIVDLQTFKVRQTMRAPGFAVGNTWCSAAIASDERHVTAGSTDGTVYIWEASLESPLPMRLYVENPVIIMKLHCRGQRSSSTQMLAYEHVVAKIAGQ